MNDSQITLSFLNVLLLHICYSKKKKKRKHTQCIQWIYHLADAILFDAELEFDSFPTRIRNLYNFIGLRLLCARIFSVLKKKKLKSLQNQSFNQIFQWKSIDVVFLFLNQIDTAPFFFSTIFGIIFFSMYLLMLVFFLMNASKVPSAVT